MADYSKIFTLDDEEDILGGFNELDAPDISDSEPDKDKDTTPDGKETKDADTENADIDTDSKSEADQEGTGEGEIDDKKDDIDDTNSQSVDTNAEPAVSSEQQAMIDKLVATIAKQSEQLATLQQVAISDKDKPAKLIEEPLEAPQFSVEEWELDPKKCTEAIVEYREKIKEREAAKEADRFAREQAAKQTELAQAHEIGWATVVKAMPELNTNEPTPLRMRYAQHFEKYKGDPLGTIKAMYDLENDPVAATLRQSSQPAGNANTVGNTNDNNTRGVPDNERQSRVVQGTMHGRGKGGGQQKISLTPQQESARRLMGVSKESYLETLKAMGIEGGE